MIKGNLFVISGPSGTGKGTICEQLVKRNDLYLSISSTTRDKRAGECDGITYNFTSVESFKAMIEQNLMLEWAVYNNNYYGTPKTTVDLMLNQGKNVILEIDAQGALKVKAMIPEAVLIFIAPPSMQELKRRLTERGRETPLQINERLSSAIWELEQADKYNHIVVNDSLADCVREVSDIIDCKIKEVRVIEALLQEKV